MAWGRCGKVEICGINTTELPLLSPQKNKEYLQKMKNGDKEARQKLIDGNMRLVLSIPRSESKGGSLRYARQRAHPAGNCGAHGLPG